jgi:hypothetical protein
MRLPARDTAPMEVLLRLLKRDARSGEWIEDGTPIRYRDDLMQTAVEKANRYGQRWQAKDRKNHRYRYKIRPRL